MKKIIYSISALLLSFTFASCSMEENPYAVTAEQLAKSEDGATQLVTGIYATFLGSLVYAADLFGMDGLRPRP